MIKKLFFSLIFIFSYTQSQTYTDSTNVLFIGNSITYFNSMPFLFKKISNTKNKKVSFDQYTPGGTGFVNHVQDPSAYQKIKSRIWDYVVLQPGSGESTSQSYLPDVTGVRGKQLKDSILKYSPCAKVFLYEIPYGVPSENQFSVYFTMQKRIKDSMTKVCNIMQVPMIPAGEAVREAYLNNQNDFLHVGYNDIHPNEKGSFIIAATMFSNIFQENSTGSNYYGEVGQTNANLYFGYVDAVAQTNLAEYSTNLHPRAQYSYNANNNQFQFNSSSNLANSHKWDFGDGESSPLINPNHTYSELGTYQVCLKINETHCPVKICKNIVVNTLSTSENEKKYFQLYPNPSKDKFIVKMEEDIISFEIYDSIGRKIISKLNENINKNELLINENLNKGNYYLKIITNKGKIDKQIIIN